jgi:ABC-type transport system involved in cytochrome c biogenesis ATPase subunit
MLCNSNLWLLDEVYTNLDGKNKSMLDFLISSKANNGGIVIVTSHSGLNIKNTLQLNLSDWI